MEPEVEMTLTGVWLELLSFVGMALNLIAAVGVLFIVICALLHFYGSRRGGRSPQTSAARTRPRLRAYKARHASRQTGERRIVFVFKYLLFPRVRENLLPQRLHKK